MAITKVFLSRKWWCNGQWEDNMHYWYAYSDEGSLASASSKEELIGICNKAGWVIVPPPPRKAIPNLRILG